MDPIRLVVEGAGYNYWYDEDPRDFSASFSHRGGSSTTSIRITRDDGIKAAFYPTSNEFEVWGWWGVRHGDGSMAGICKRAVQIAVRNGSQDYWIKDDERCEVYAGPAIPLAEELPVAAAAFAAADYHLVVAMLAVGCKARDVDREILDDWVASHANEIAASPLVSWLDEPALSDLDAYKTRSAFQFLVELCGRVNVDLGLDTKAWDKQLEDRKPHTRPWGVPADHWWWRQRRTRRDGEHYYPFADD